MLAHHQSDLGIVLVQQRSQVDRRGTAADDGDLPTAEAGSFGSLPSNRIDRGEAMFGEVLEAFHDFVSEAPYEGQRGISARGEHLGRVPCMGARLIFTAADVAHIMKTVLDAPVRT